MQTLGPAPPTQPLPAAAPAGARHWLTDTVPQPGLHVCERLPSSSAGGDGCIVRVHFDCCATGRVAEVELVAADLASADATRQAIDAKFGLPQRDPMQQPWALFSVEGERLETLPAGSGAVWLLVEGGQFVRPGVRIGHKQRVALGGGATVEMETISLTPLIFSVAKFLSDAE